MLVAPGWRPCRYGTDSASGARCGGYAVRCVLGHTDVYWYIMICVLVRAGMWRVHGAVDWSVLVSTDVSRCVLVFTEMYWVGPVCTGEYRYVVGALC